MKPRKYEYEFKVSETEVDWYAGSLLDQFREGLRAALAQIEPFPDLDKD